MIFVMNSKSSTTVASPDNGTAGAAVRRYRLPVEGMTCSDCERHVSNALQQAGALDPVANFRRGEARVTAPGSVGRDALRHAVANSGYRPGKLEIMKTEGRQAP